MVVNKEDMQMLVQVNTDDHIDGSESLAEEIETVVRNSLARFSEQITRVEVHLSDENSDKKAGANDKRCLLETRLAGLRPISANHHAGNVQLAVDGAVEKMKRSLDSTLGRLGRA
ncbi:MAG: HPF/RaiA family ribosome-associated protein [Rhodothermales bacterium]